MTTKSNHARIMLKNPPQISANKNIEKKKPKKSAQMAKTFA